LVRLPERELEKALPFWYSVGEICTYKYLVRKARPYWLKECRQRKHIEIRTRAADKPELEVLGTFPLISTDI
jgi:hypothetical protein